MLVNIELTMFENFVFTGFGHSYGKYKISNKDIENAVEKGFLGGFSKDKISRNKKYIEFCNENGNISPLEYFAENIMGFKERHHVTPFPPTKKKLHYAETSLDLAVRAIDEALSDASIKSNQIAAWYISTVSPHEQAPGIAATVKSHFVDSENQTPCFSLASGCSGFNTNLQRAIEFFKQNPEAEHIIIAHTETMSGFLRQRIKFIPFVTFGDAASAVVLSRICDVVKFGLIDVVNLHDMHMLDYVGVDANQNLYMDDSLIKDRAIINIPYAASICLKKSEIKTSEIDMLVPHQTGNVILHQAAQKLNIPLEKIYLEVQKRFGNVSGATVPLCFYFLNQSDMLKPGMKILSATAGVGGTYGAFTYIVGPKASKNKMFYKYKDDLKGKNVIVFGASGKLGIRITEELEKRAANLFLHGNKKFCKLKQFKSAKIYKADFHNETEELIANIKKDLQEIHYVIFANSDSSAESAFDINFLKNSFIIRHLFPMIKGTLLIIGTPTEEITLTGDEEWTESYRSLHGYLSSASGEFLKAGVRIVYFIPGFTNYGITEIFEPKEKFRFMQKIGQPNFLNITHVAKNIVKSLYIPKISETETSYENAMIVRRMGYKLDVDI